MSSNILNELMQEVRRFAEVRNWGQFHTPKNLAMAIAGEAGELAAEFQWLTPEESMSDALTVDQKKSIELEIADVQIYLLRLADVLGIDIAEVVREKLLINQERFAVDD